MAKREPKQRASTDRLKIETDWQTAARKLLATKPGTTPPRAVKPRKKRA